MPTAAEICHLALQHHQAGNLRQAEVLYRQILQADPSHADAHHLLGVLATQVGSFDRAIASIRQAIALNPQIALYHCNLGAAHEALGQLEEAVASYRQALRLRPDYAEAHCNLGNALSSQAKLDEAIGHYQQALSLRTDLAEAHNGIGNVLSSQGCGVEAMSHFRHALRLRPDSYEVHNNIANTLLRQGKSADAIRHYRHALRVRPDSAEAHNNLGNALVEQGEIDQALRCYEEALRLRPNFAEARNSLGIALHQQDNFLAAIACFHEALRLKPNYAAAFTNLGNAHRDQGKLEEALACFEEALRLDPGCAEMHHNRALLWLLQGNWSMGWPEFEWRWQTKDFPRFEIEQPRWNGSPLTPLPGGERGRGEGGTLLVLAEQGLGDTLQFIRYLPLVQKSVNRIVLSCQTPLQRLLAGCWGKFPIVDQAEPIPRVDAYIPLVSLPGILGTTPSSISADVPYMYADKKLVDHWKTALCRVSRFLVGIAWQGSRAYRNDRQRSIPLRHFTQLANVKHVRLVSLQKGPGTEQLKKERGTSDEGREASNTERDSVAKAFSLALRSSLLVPILDEDTGAFMETAAVMTHLDLVITSDTSIAHLAGALGVPVWVALPLVPDWRWLLHREDCPWYPTMRLFRQTHYGQWEDVFDRIVKELEGATDGTRMKHG